MKDYYRQLLQSRDKDLAFNRYTGRKWFISKGMLVLASLLMIFQADQTVIMTGLVLLGYVAGAAGADVRGYFAAKAKWRIQRTLIDWKHVEEHLQSAGR